MCHIDQPRDSRQRKTQLRKARAQQGHQSFVAASEAAENFAQMRQIFSWADPSSIIQELEVLRQAQDYREHPSLDSLRGSFFLHVAYLHMKKQKTSTLTLRESISLAHMLDLHKPSHYDGLSDEEGNDHLRVLWLLFITER